MKCAFEKQNVPFGRQWVVDLLDFHAHLSGCLVKRERVQECDFFVTFCFFL
jgi:hypothetical protein